MTLLQQAEADCEVPADKLAERLLKGDRCVRYAVCVSFGLGTWQAATRFKLCRSENWQYWYAFGPTIATAILGWWAVPWGPLLTLRALWVNFSGGEDLTLEVYKEYQESLT